MSELDNQTDLLMQNIEEVEGSVDLQTALEQESVVANAEKLAKAQAKEAAKLAKAQKAAEAKAIKERIKAEKEEAKALAKAEKEDAKAARLAAKAAAKAIAKAPRQIQNGQKLPREGSTCLKAWQLFQFVSEQKGAVCTAKEANDYNLTLAEPLNQNMLKVNHWAWKKYYGLSTKVAVESESA